MNITESRKPESVPSFDPHIELPYKKGECPEAGWYAIEPAGEYLLADSPQRIAAKEQKPEGDLSLHKELIDETCLRQLVEVFDPTDCGGNGIPINENHLYLNKGQTDKARGYIRALATDGQQLYAYLSLTAQGHAEVNEAEFWATSTEYLYGEYSSRGQKSGATYWSPTVLRGLAFTNHPNRAEQKGIVRVNSRTGNFHQPPQGNMNEQEKKPTDKDSQTPTEDEMKKNELDKEKDPVAAQSEEGNEDDVKTNDDDASDALGDFLNELASIFGYGDEMDGEAMLEALRVHKADFDALASAGAKAANSAPRPRFPRATAPATRINSGARPAVNATMSVRVGDSHVRVNSREVALANHCERAVATEARRLGRNLTAQEFRAINAEAESTFQQ